MPEDKKDGAPQEDKILSRLKSGPAQTPVGVTSFVGLLGRSPKDGYWLLYLSLDMTRFVEIKETDIVHSEQLPPDRSPFGSLGGTQIFVRQDATLTTSKTVSQAHAASEPPDEFDLDIQLGASSSAALLPLPTRLTCPDSTCRTGCDTCPGDTCVTCDGTCRTNCGTCRTCQTCQTRCGQNTCVQTCQTCQTQCGQNTCMTCQTCQTNC